jgi:hypothetical protein
MGRSVIADTLSKAGWSWGCISAIDSNGRTIFVADAHRLTEGPTRCADQKSRAGVGATSQSPDIIGVMTCPQMIHGCPAWVYKSKSNS